MELLNPYTGIIVICIIIILSNQFNWISKKSNIPSVLMLLVLGIVIRLGLDYFNIGISDYLNDMLLIIGTVGLIMIILEAALELKLTREKRPLIIKSFFLALFSLCVNISFTTWILHIILIESFPSALLYAVPISVVSSAVVIPGVANLVTRNREFLIYESTFSDILGILIFFYLASSLERNSASDIIVNISLDFVITIVLSVVISYLMVIVLEKIRSEVKLFSLIAVLVLLYSAGKLMNFSSILMILIFGIILNNNSLFFAGKLKKIVNLDSLHKVKDDFHILTMEFAFFIGTFFFVIFGITLQLESLADMTFLWVSVVVVLGLYIIRFISMKIFIVKRIIPGLFISPRGLVTILLFFSIPSAYQDVNFNPGILLYIIIITNIAMSVSLMVRGKDREYADSLNFSDWDELDREIRSLSKKK